MKIGTLENGRLKIKGWSIMVLKETVLIWYEVEITLFQNINSKEIHYMIYKTGIKQIRINSVSEVDLRGEGERGGHMPPFPMYYKLYYLKLN